MKANTKYTAKEILVEAGAEVESIGKMRVRIGGIAGINTPDHLIKVQPGTEEVSVVVGEESYTVKVEGENEQTQVTELANEALVKKGKEASENVRKPDPKEVEEDVETPKE